VEEYVIQIDFIDRPGLGYEIFTLLEQKNIDKIAMEVLPKRGMVLKFRCDLASKLQRLAQELTSVAGVQSLQFRDQMPYEEREEELKTILNSVSEGILAVDKSGKITHANEVARQILHCDSCAVIGLAAETLLDAQHPILATLYSGQSYKLKEVRITRAGQSIRYLTSGEPVINEKGQIIGAVATITDYCQVEAIVSKADKIRYLTTFDEIVFQSEKMRRLVTAARTVARSSSTVLLRGESGTGKELFASALHTASPRHQAPFIAVNCAAVPEALLESELFGYEEGAFTGAAHGGKKGLFEQANGGTLFLDEIGELPQQMQVKLLRALQAGTIRKVGGKSELRVDIRVIAATHRNLEEMVHKGIFREDLYYRLNVIPLTIPPLRERKEDVFLIAQQLIRKICAKLNKSEIRLARQSAELLMKQSWPGNVRQLENTLERVINLVDCTEIQPCHFKIWAELDSEQEIVAVNQTGSATLQVEIPCGQSDLRLKEVIAKVEKEIIRRVWEQYPSSRLAGQILGVSNTTVLNKIHSYGL